MSEDSELKEKEEVEFVKRFDHKYWWYWFVVLGIDAVLITLFFVFNQGVIVL